jgi:hypothetical protein
LLPKTWEVIFLQILHSVKDRVWECSSGVKRAGLLREKQASVLVFRLSRLDSLLACACNPGYLGGLDREDHGSSPAWTNSLRDPISVEKQWGSDAYLLSSNGGKHKMGGSWSRMV